jgi:hypothetical protein
MAVDIYEELLALGARITKLEAAAVKPTRLAPVTYFRADKLDADGTPAWDKVIAARPALALINPGSGPGTLASTSYAALVPKVQAAGVPVFGYTHTRYGLRPALEVKADKHKLWYGVRGIFIDTTSNKPEHVAYYQDLCSYAHGLGLLVVLNAGTQCLEEHAVMADYVMCSEGDVPTYRARVPRAWEAQYAAKLWHCVHSCPPAEMPGIVALAKARRAGLLFVTDDLMANPFDRLPVYFDALAAEIVR